ncbi:MAG: pyridoxamine 5'-phosphate oxidase [Bacteroidetes bacterium]|nr:pyridoxamine 5'-phosphate oxidase [Bacteroidota bacterium]
MDRKTIQGLRNEYLSGILEESGLPDNPQTLFGQWLKEAIGKGIPEANAMALSTVSSEGRPSSRIVLMKDYQDGSPVFFTNYSSRKAGEIENNSAASLLFFWKELDRQIRIEGFIQKTKPEVSDEYFLERPGASRVGAIISPQSMEIPDRSFLENRFDEFMTQKDVLKEKRPQFWGGYQLIPDYYEFWQGRENRLHDRICYRKAGKAWTRARLAP